MNRVDSPKTLEDLQEVKQIPTENQGPQANTTWLSAYLKTRSLLAFIDGNFQNQITREAETCEILHKNPHPSEHCERLWLHRD